ncbi:hypothetical protein JCM11491_006958 [Sporobolomyces phaffii]
MKWAALVAVCAVLAPQAFADLTPAQLSSVFPGAANGTLSGSTKTVNQLAVTVVTNSTHALYHLNSTNYDVTQTGWMSVGLGSKMSNADFLMAWPMTSGSKVDWVLSHRVPNGAHGTPQMASTSSSVQTTDFYTIVPELSTTATGSPFTTVAWLRALTPPANYPTSSAVSSSTIDRTSTSLKMIYASASKDPSSTNEASDVAQHNRPYGSFSIDISQPINLASSSPVGGATTGAGKASSSGGWTHRDKVLIAHAAIGSIAAVLFVPAGILLARLGRSGTWFPWHRAIQLFSVTLIIVAAILGITQNSGPHFSDDHQRLGIILLALFVVQPLLGVFAHATQGAGAPLTSARPQFARPFPSVVRVVHVVVGVVTAGVAYWQVATGFDEWQTSSDRLDSVPTAVKAVFWILLAIAVVLYVAAWILGAVRGRRRTARTGATGSEETFNPSPASGAAGRDDYLMTDHSKFQSNKI